MQIRLNRMQRRGLTALHIAARLLLALVLMTLFSGNVFADGDWADVERTPYIRAVIDHTKIDEPLADFPVLIHLSDRCGRNGFDATPFFSAISEADQRKIALFTEGGRQCHAEIEKWEWDGESRETEAWIWVKVPYVSACADTVIRIYYDPSREDNWEHVGGTIDFTTPSVWDSAYLGVWHMKPETGENWGCIQDSTENRNRASFDAVFDWRPAGGVAGEAVFFQGYDAESQRADRVEIDLGTAEDLATHTLTVFTYPKSRDSVGEPGEIGRAHV